METFALQTGFWNVHAFRFHQGTPQDSLMIKDNIITAKIFYPQLPKYKQPNEH